MDREKGDGNTILLTVIGVATLLVALVGATFAYFSAQITNDSNQSVYLTTAAPVGLEYLGQRFALTNIAPGTSNTEEQGSFTVQNPDNSGFKQSYDLELKIDANTLNTIDGAKQLLLTITSDDATISDHSTSDAPAPVITADDERIPSNGLLYDLTDGASVAGKAYKFVDNQVINIGATHTYKMKLEFVNFETPQDNNQGKSFQAHIEISDPVSIN